MGVGHRESDEAVSLPAVKPLGHTRTNLRAKDDKDQPREARRVPGCLFTPNLLEENMTAHRICSSVFWRHNPHSALWLAMIDGYRDLLVVRRWWFAQIEWHGNVSTFLNPYVWHPYVWQREDSTAASQERELKELSPDWNFSVVELRLAKSVVQFH